MRMTNRMLQHSAARTGMPIGQSSLLNYINGNTKNNSAMLGALTKKNTTAVDTENKKAFEKLGKEAEKLIDATTVLQQEGKDSLFEKAKESDNRQPVYEGVKNLFDSYNSNLKVLKKMPGAMNDFYRQMLAETPKDEKEKLREIGITFSEDGTASIDREKLKAADLASLENMFGRKSEMVKKMNFVSSRVMNNVEANVKSFSNAYSSKGNLYSGNLNSRYDFRR